MRVLTTKLSGRTRAATDCDAREVAQRLSRTWHFIFHGPLQRKLGLAAPETTQGKTQLIRIYAARLVEENEHLTGDVRNEQEVAPFKQTADTGHGKVARFGTFFIDRKILVDFPRAQ